MALGNLASRFLVAAIGVPIILFALYQDRSVFLWGLIFPASLLAMYEFFSMAIEDKTDRVASLLMGAASVAALYWLGGSRGGEMLAMFVATVPVGLYYLFRFGDMQTSAARLGVTVTGIVYCGLLFTFLAMIKRDFGAAGGDMALLVLAIAWLGDTGAYFAGRFLGKSKLYPAVSPGKTWAGAFGGLLGSAIGVAVIKVLRIDELGWVDVALIALPGAALGQMGDLVESLIKRSTGVKDSGSILPGHGGILDRIDAVLFIAPYVYLYILYKPQIVALF